MAGPVILPCLGRAGRTPLPVTRHPEPPPATRNDMGSKGNRNITYGHMPPANHPVPGLPLIAAALCSTNPLGLRASHCIPCQLAN